MRLYFSGAENPGWRNKLVNWGAKSVSINFTHLVPRLPKTKPYLISEKFPDDVRVIAHFDVPPEAPELVNVYLAWVQQNADRLDFAVEPDGIPAEDLEAIRADYPVLPIWRPESGHRTLTSLADHYSGLCVLQSAWDSDRPVTARINRTVQTESTYVHGLGVSKAEILSSVALSSVSTGSWMSATRYGETQIWDGSELKRFPAQDKESRQRYRAHIAHSGLDLDKIDADDSDEVSRLAVWSWQQLEEWLSRRREVPTEVIIGPMNEDRNRYDGETPTLAAGDREDQSPVTTGARGGTNRATVPIPIMESVHNEQADPVVRLRSTTSRMCDSCSISALCPGYEPGSSCAYDIPVEIKTKDQLVALLSGALEMQAQRVMFARFREDLEGSIDPVVSKEVDRLFSITAQYKDIVDNAETLKVQIEAKSNAGMLSRIFGSKVGDQARALPGGGLDVSETEHMLSKVVGAEPVDWTNVPSTTAIDVEVDGEYGPD